VTRAERADDGTWVLDGRKLWIGNGHRAGVIVTFAQTTGTRGAPREAGSRVHARGTRTVDRPTAFIIRPDMPGSDFSLEAACTKVFASDMIWRVSDEMVQVAGGRGFVKPYPFERMLRDARINRIVEGTNEVLRLFMALNGIQGRAERLKEIGTALRRPLRNLGLVSGYAASRVRSMLGATDRLDAPLDARLAEHGRYFEKHVAELHAATERAITTHRRGMIVERQLVLERLANMAIEMFATASVLARTERLIEERGADACASELALCDLFCVEAGRRFRAQRLALEGREQGVDDVRRAIAADVRARGGYVAPDAMLGDEA